MYNVFRKSVDYEKIKCYHTNITPNNGVEPTSTPFNLFRLVIKRERSKDNEEQYEGIVSQTP